MCRISFIYGCNITDEKTCHSLSFIATLVHLIDFYFLVSFCYGWKNKQTNKQTKKIVDLKERHNMIRPDVVIKQF